MEVAYTVEVVRGVADPELTGPLRMEMELPDPDAVGPAGWEEEVVGAAAEVEAVLLPVAVLLRNWAEKEGEELVPAEAEDEAEDEAEEAETEEVVEVVELLVCEFWLNMRIS